MRLFVLLAIALTLLVAIPHPARALTGVGRAGHVGRIITIRLDGTARVLDQTPAGSIPPPRWAEPQFDDSAWALAAQVSPSMQSCVGKQVYTGYRALYPGAYYWGDLQTDHYLLRQAFTLPTARDYYGSEVGVIGSYATSAFYLYVNGHVLNLDYRGNPTYYAGTRYNMEKYVRPGRNVIAINAYPNSSPQCSGLQLRAVIHATGAR